MLPESPERLRARLDLLAEAIRSEGCLSLVAEGGSMHPAIRSGETVQVRPPRLGDLRFGNVLQCRDGPQTVVHRLVRTTRRGGHTLYVTKGDNCLAFDRPVPAEDVLGVVETVGGRRARNRLLAFLSLAQGLAYAWVMRNPLARSLGGFKFRHLSRRSFLVEFNRGVSGLLRRLGP